MGLSGPGMSFGVHTNNAPEQPDAQGHIRSSPSKAQQHSSAGVAAAAHAQQQRSSTQAFDQQLTSGNDFGASRPLQQQGARDARSMGDQAKQQPSTAGPADAGPAAAAAPAPTAAWASFMSGFQQQAYESPGARAGGRRGGQQRKGATPRASRMQQRPAAGAPPAHAAAGFGSPAGPMFAFGLPMQQAGEAGAAGGAAAAGAAAGAAGATPAPSTLPPGSAMSMDTSLPTAFTAAFSAMSVDAATPAAFGTNSSAGGSSQQWAFRGPRAAAVTGKRLFDTPSSAGGPGDSSSAPSPFGSWGRPGAQDGSAQQPAAPSGASRGGANPVPFPGFGGAQDGTVPGVSSPAGGFAFNPGKPSPMTSGRKGRHSRGSPAAQKPPPAPPALGGFGSPAFAAPTSSSVSANSSASAATPAMASGGSFQGFFGGGAKVPGSAASTPGFSPMMWSPAEAQAAAAAGAAASPAAAAAAAPGAGVGFGAVSGRAQSAAASQAQVDAKLQQAAQQLSQQQASAAAAAAGAAAETLAAAAVDLPSDDSTESVAELLADLSTSGNRAAAAARPETAAMAGLREAVEQLSTAETQQKQQQQQQALPSFMFGSPADTGAGGGSGSAWLSSPADAGISPTTLFEMSPLKSAGATNQQKQDAAASAAAAAAAAAPPSQQQPAPPAAAPTAPQPVFSAAGPAPAAATATGFGVFGAGTSGPAAPSFGVGAGGGAGAAGGGGGGFSFTPGKAAGSSRGPGRARKPTPTKQHKGTAAAPCQDWGSAPFNSSAAAGQQPSRTFVGQQQQDDDSDEGPQAASVFGNYGGSSNPFAPQQEQQQRQQQQQQPAAGSTPGRRKLHAQPRRANQPHSQQQQQQQAGATHGWPPSAAQQPWPPAAAPAAPAPAAVNLQFTLGTGKVKAGVGSTPVKSPRKARPAPAAAAAQQFPPQPQQQQQQQGPPQPSAQLQDALRQADVWTQHAQASFAAQNWSQADGEFQQGMAALQPYREQPEGAQKLSSLHMHRAAVRIGGGDPQGALRDSLEAIKLHKKNIEAYLRTATCLSKLGCLTAADRVLDKVLDMISARHDSWQALNRKRQQVHQLAHKQQRVVAAALGCDSAAAAAKLAALSAGQPVQELLQGFVSTCSARQSGAGTAAAVAALSGEGMGPLEDAAAVQELVADAQSLITELGYWEDGTAMLAWLLLRSGQLGRAASVADAHPNAFFEKEPLHSNKQWGWRWWVLAQVRWQQGELTVAKQLLQEGHAQLQKLAQHGANSSSSSGLWRLLLPAEQELPELLQQLQQLLSLKEAGNAAIQAKQYDKAAEAYTKALALQPSCGFAAVIHSNRAAALQQQKRLVEALADCSRAVALDPKYARAYLRMAQVLESLHRADRAVVVLQDALKGAANAVDPATTRGHELTHGAALLQLGSADRRKFEDMLATAQVAARRFKTPHHYKTLGLAMGATEADIRKAYRALALKHHPDKALQHCRWSARLGSCGAAAAHLTAPSGGVEASLKAAANEVFGLLSSAHEELTNATSRSKVDRDLRTEEQLYSNNGSSSSYSRPAAYTYAYGGRRTDSDYGFEDLFRRTAAAGGGSGSSSGTYGQSQARARPGGASAAGGGARPGAGGGGAAAGRGGQAGGGSRWYENNYWGEEDEGDLESDEDEYDYGQGYGQSGWHYSNPRSKY